MLRRYIIFLKKHPLTTATIAIVYAVICIKSIKTETFFQMMLLRTLLCGAMAFFLYQISGDKTLTSSYNSTWYVIKTAIGFWIMALPIGIINLFANAEYPVWDNIPLQMLITFGLFMSVGLFEEMAFRAVINDAIIYRFRDKKYVFVLSAVTCSLVFGVVHVVGYRLESLLAWGQAIGKVVSVGVFGLGLLLLYWKTRNIWACGVVHGVYDFLLSIADGIFNNPIGKNIEYVAPDDKAMMVIAVYAVCTLINLIIVFVIWKKVGKQIDYEDIRKNW